jgi:hypothetical protein
MNKNKLKLVRNVVLIALYIVCIFVLLLSWSCAVNRGNINTDKPGVSGLHNRFIFVTSTPFIMGLTFSDSSIMADNGNKIGWYDSEDGFYLQVGLWFCVCQITHISKDGVIGDISFEYGNGLFSMDDTFSLIVPTGLNVENTLKAITDVVKKIWPNIKIGD